MNRKNEKTFAFIILAALMAGCFSSTPDNSTGSDDATFETVAGAVPFGQWGNVEKHDSGKYYLCKVRIAEIIRDNAEVQSRIDLYNTKSDSNHVIAPLTGKDKDLTKYIVIEYEVLFPDDFPTINYGNRGIFSPYISFDAKTNDDGGFTASDGTYYVGMGIEH